MFILIFSGCKEYKNRGLYNIRIGETFELYVAENSCCIYSWANAASVKSVKLLEKKLVEEADSDCDGCSSSYAWLYKGVSVGTDTIKIANIPAGGEDKYLLNPDRYIKSIYIVNVSK